MKTSMKNKTNLLISAIIDISKNGIQIGEILYGKTHLIEVNNDDSIRVTEHNGIKGQAGKVLMDETFRIK